MTHAKLCRALAVVALLVASTIPVAGFLATNAQAQSTTAQDRLPPEVASAFNQSHIIAALHDRNLNVLRDDVLTNYFYTKALVAALSAPDAWYRMGAEMEARLDPDLAVDYELALIRNPQLSAGMMARGKDVLGSILNGFVKERQRNVANGTVDPMAEINGMLQPLARRGGPSLMHLKARATLDGRRLMLLAQRQPHTFMRIYAGLRFFIDNI